MSLLPVGFGASGDDYEITDSLRFRQSAGAYLSRTFSTPTDGKVWTYSVWVKRAKAPSVLGYGTGHFICTAGSGAQGNFGWGWNNADDIAFIFGGYGRRYTTGVFRDPSAWYHIVLKVDTTQATEANRALLYVNGALFPWNTQSSISQNSTTQINQAVAHNIGRQTGQPYESFDGYMTEANFIDGQALDPTDFGEYDANGTWKAKEYTGTYGTNGFYLPMKPTTQAELQNTVLYAGNTNKQSIDGVGYAPDFVWIKNRTGANNHYLYDTVRGTDRSLSSQSTGAESVGAQQLTSFDTDGFTVPYDVSGYNNYAGRSYVAWTWDAGDNQTSTGISSVLYVGQGVAQSVKGFGFSPDLILFKNRASASPLLIDSVRGPSQELQTNSTSAETSNGVTRFKSIDSDGFTLADTTSSSLNTQNNNYVAWGWDAGDGDPVSNTTGDINSTVKASDATGFSIVSYTGNGTSGATIGHGLSSTPKMIIVKNRTTAGADWPVYHEDAGNTGALYLNTTAGFATDSTRWNNTSPTSTVFTVGNGQGVNHNSASLIAYCFSEVSGISKIDSYTGTGSTGNAITGLGFRPGFVMIKSSSIGSQSWHIYDGSRNPFNPVTLRLHTNSSSAEDALRPLGDFNSDGFTINSTQDQLNQNGATYIYIAFKGSYSDYVSPLNDTGSIDSRVKANTTQGFSVVSYEGDGSASSTVGHGLSSSAEMIILKDREVTNNWRVWHKDLSTNYWMYLNLTNAQASAATDGGLRNVNATTFGFINGTTAGVEAVNTNGRAYIAYCWHSVAGYSKFGSYTGTGVAGNSVTGLGFQPAWLMIKCSSTASTPWVIYDNTREPDNDNNDLVLQADNASAELDGGGTTRAVTFDSDGFTLDTTYGGNNGSSRTYIYMAFADTRDAQFNFDASGNKNNWLPNNINSNGESETTYDLMKDTPSLVDENAANFATLNPLDNNGVALTEANLTGVIATNENVSATIAPTSGKWYWEVYIVDSTNPYIGVKKTESNITGYSGDAVGINTAGDIYFNGSNQGKDGLPNFSNGDVVGVGLDVDAQKIWWSKNGQWYTADAATESPIASSVVVAGNNGYSYGSQITNVKPYVGSSTTTGSVSVNFGQRPFAYTPPTGFLKLNTFNLPDSTIEDGSDYFAPLLYDGAGGSQTITGLEFQPDWVWIKSRSAAYTHGLFDSNRGVQKLLQSNSTAAEITNAIYLTSFNSDGFSIGGTQFLNGSGETFVSWNWLANGTGVSNTVGTIPSTVSANTTAGFSIVSYTGTGTAGATVGHGLSSAPKFLVTKSRTTGTYDWVCQHTSLGGTKRIWLNLTSAANTSSGPWNNTDANASVVTLGNFAETNHNGDNFIMYCFAEVPGYSSFGSYTGNGSSDGPFVYTGFRPAFVIIKETTNTGSWVMLDTTRSTYNVINNDSLWANLISAEGGSASYFDMLSNGFKIRDTDSDKNTSGQTYIYMTFAENPFKNALAR